MVCNLFLYLISMGEINKIRRTSFIPRTDAQLLHKEPLFVFLMGPRVEEVANPIAQEVKHKHSTIRTRVVTLTNLLSSSIVVFTISHRTHDT